MEWLENRGFEMTNIYVGNLSYHMTDEQLSEAFSAYGTVSSARIIMDRDTGRSKGFGFVEMENDAEATEAIAKMDGQEVDGRALKVNVARPREERPRRPSW